MSLTLGERLIFPPGTTPDLSFLTQPLNTTHSSTLSLPTQIYRRGDNHGGGIKARWAGEDPLDSSSFGLSLCLHAFTSSDTPSSCSKMLKRFCRVYFGRQSIVAAVAGGARSSQPEEEEESDLHLDGGSGSSGGGGGKQSSGGNRGGGGSFDGGDLELEAYPLWWWWQRLSKPETGRKSFEIDIPRPEKEKSEMESNSNNGEERRRRWWRDFLGKLKKGVGKLSSEKVLEAIVWPFVWITMTISEPVFRRFARQCFRPLVPFPIAFVQYIHMTVDYALTITFLLMMGTSLLLLALLLWWAWRLCRQGGRDSAGDGDGVDQDSDQDDYSGDEDEF